MNIFFFVFDSRRQPLNGYYLGALFFYNSKNLNFCIRALYDSKTLVFLGFFLPEVLFVQAAFGP